MANYILSKDFKSIDNSEIYDVLFEEISKKKSISSITGVDYKIITSDADFIEFSAPSRNSGDPEKIHKDEFKSVFKIIKTLDTFNTSNTVLKKEMPSTIYKKRSPLFAILLAGGVIIRVK